MLVERGEPLVLSTDPRSDQIGEEKVEFGRMLVPAAFLRKLLVCTGCPQSLDPASRPRSTRTGHPVLSSQSWLLVVTEPTLYHVLSTATRISSIIRNSNGSEPEQAVPSSGGWWHQSFTGLWHLEQRSPRRRSGLSSTLPTTPSREVRRCHRIR